MSMRIASKVSNPLLTTSSQSSRLNVRICDKVPVSRGLHTVKRQRWSQIWLPQANVNKENEGAADATQLLTNAGYVRQAYSGIYHMLPLGLRVQQKIENLVEKHMNSLSASKLAMSSISSQKLWDQSGRLSGDKEFFKFQDRKDASWLLAPTHEEEITTLVMRSVFAPNHLPLRLYQISRKYRDEKRPRGGLLRGREFIMKDLYTFDKSEEEAHATYEAVRRAYKNLFAELTIPFIEAQADSGNMGGDLSHEFHLPSKAGEDDVITCTNCHYARNEEYVPQLKAIVAQYDLPDSKSSSLSDGEDQQLVSQTFLGRDGTSLVRTFAKMAGSSTKQGAINAFAVKKGLKGIVDVDTGVEAPEESFRTATRTQSSKGGDDVANVRVYYLFDQLMNESTIQALIAKDRQLLEDSGADSFVVKLQDPHEKRSHLLQWQEGEDCPRCQSHNKRGKLTVTKAIEVGHTFHLGNRYSSKFNFIVPGTGTRSPVVPPVEVSMGCHGIGVSRLIAAVAATMADGAGLNWPRVIAPFEVVILVDKKQPGAAGMKSPQDIADELYDHLTQNGADVLIDDRTDVSLGWKLKDADLIGYPVLVVVGKAWRTKGALEIQSRRMKVKEAVAQESAADRVTELLAKL